MRDISLLEPKKVFSYFARCSSVPHGSGNTKAVSDLVMRIAGEKGWEAEQDSFNNVIIRKPATPGYENSPTVILQGHLDMVCAKYPEDDVDMAKDPIRLCTDGEWLWADRTSLGGDDMIAVACALAVLDDGTLPHPALECLFTADEETGMDGAVGLDGSRLKGRLLLNMDSEDEGVFTVGCAGGTHIELRLPGKKEALPAGSRAYRLTVDGLLGGHSGCEIEKERGNSNLLCARILHAAAQTADVRLLRMEGGVFDNVIPSATEAVFAVTAKDAPAAEEAVRTEIRDLTAEYAASDAGLRVTLEPSEEAGEFFCPADSKKMLSLLFLLPNGVQNMSMALPGLVQTSLSSGILRLSGDGLFLTCFLRSAINSQRRSLAGKIRELAALFGAECDIGGEFPAWEYRADSPLRDTATRAYRAVSGKEARVFATHGGLECGILSEKLPGLDCVAFGPDMKDIHSVNEKLNVASVGRFYALLCRILADLK